MILGLDISTSSTGWSIIDTNGKLVSMGAVGLSHLPDLYEKCDAVSAVLKCLDVKPTHIFVEQNMLGFRAGASSANTLITLARFNGIISNKAYEVFGVKPTIIPVRTARSKVGVKIDKGQDPKQAVIAWLRVQEPDYNFPTRVIKTGKRKGEVVLDHGTDDAADAYVMAKAGLLIHVET
jgi:Holliday junction resolvasome RuvABC endonuclease subunit